MRGWQMQGPEFGVIAQKPVEVAGVGHAQLHHQWSRFARLQIPAQWNFLKIINNENAVEGTPILVNPRTCGTTRSW